MGLDILVQPQQFNSFTSADGSKSVTQTSFTTNIGFSSKEAIASGKNLFVLDSVNFPSNPLRQVISDGGNFRIGTTDPTLIIGTNSEQHLRFRAGGDTNSEIRMTILSSGEVGIGTTLAQTRAQQLASVVNGNFSNITGLIDIGGGWYQGVPVGWQGVNTSYTVFLQSGNYVANLNTLATGSGSSSFRQNLGVLPIMSDINLTFDYANTSIAPWSQGILNAAIYDGSLNPLATFQSSNNGYGTYSLIATGVPAGTTIIVGFWPNPTGAPALDNVSVTASNDTKFTTSGSISASSVITSSRIQIQGGVVVLKNLPTSSTGLPSGTVWNNSGVLNIV